MIRRWSASSSHPATSSCFRAARAAGSTDWPEASTWTSSWRIFASVASSLALSCEEGPRDTPPSCEVGGEGHWFARVGLAALVLREVDSRRRARYCLSTCPSIGALVA